MKPWPGNHPGVSTSLPRRWLVIAPTVALALALTAGPASANHTKGVLDCGSAGTFSTEAASDMPPSFGTPSPRSSLFLLEGTTQVFRAFAIVTPLWSFDQVAAEKSPRDLLSCTLTSSGFNFDQPWRMIGILVP